MKKLIIFCIVFLPLTIFSQQNLGFSYQGLIRGVDGSIIKNRLVSIRIDLISNSTSGSILYSESHTIETNSLGVFDITIGQGSQIGGSFFTIDWGEDRHFLKVSVDENAGSNFVELGVTQLIAVPYAKYADEAAIASEALIAQRAIQADNAAVAERAQSADFATRAEMATLAEEAITVRNLDINDADSDPTNELQSIEMQEFSNGVELFLSPGDGNPVFINTPDVPDPVWNEFSSSIQSPDSKEVVLNGRLSRQNDFNLGSKELNIFDSNGNAKSRLGVESPSNYGFLRINGPDNNLNFRVTGLSDNLNNGWMGIYDGSGELALSLYSQLSDGSGQLRLYDSGTQRVRVQLEDSGYGVISTFGNNHSSNFIVGVRNNNPSFGWAGVFNSAAVSKAGMTINDAGQGLIFGDIKSFKCDYPLDEEHDLWYISLEGPEAGMYQRGTSKLTDGRCEVVLPDTYTSIANMSTSTIIVTPLNSKTYGLAVVEKTENGFIVEELMDGNANFDFDWEIKSVRIGYENYEVLKPKNYAGPASDNIHSVAPSASQEK